MSNCPATASLLCSVTCIRIACKACCLNPHFWLRPAKGCRTWGSRYIVPTRYQYSLDDEFIVDRHHDGPDSHRQCRSEEMPSQYIEVLDKGHFLIGPSRHYSFWVNNFMGNQYARNAPTRLRNRKVLQKKNPAKRRRGMTAYPVRSKKFLIVDRRIGRNGFARIVACVTPPFLSSLIWSSISL